MDNQKSIVITGANSFLGQSFANYYANQNNCKVFLTSRTPCDFTNLLENKNVKYLSNIDLTNNDDLNTLKNEVNKFLPEQFHIINCVGYFPGYQSIEETDTSTAKKVFDSNILTLFGTANKLLPLMANRKGGHFIAFSAHTVYQNYPNMTAFTTAKSAVESLIKGISNEYFKDNIIANTMALATLYTQVEMDMKPNGDYHNWLKTDEVCKLVDEFISPSYNIINGNTIHLYKYSDSYFSQSYFDRIKETK